MSLNVIWPILGVDRILYGENANTSRKLLSLSWADGGVDLTTFYRTPEHPQNYSVQYGTIISKQET